MAAGQVGECGVAVVQHAAVVVKHARVRAPILPQVVVVLIVQGEVPSHNLATSTDAQVIKPFALFFNKLNYLTYSCNCQGRVSKILRRSLKYPKRLFGTSLLAA